MNVLPNPRRLLPLATVAAAAVAFAALLPAEPGATTAPREIELPVVRVEAVQNAPEQRAIRFSAVTQPVERGAAAFAMPGRIVRREVELGQIVERGATLAVLDDEPIRNQLRAADSAIRELDAQRDQIEREATRAQRLIDAEIGTAQLLERIESDRLRLAAAREAASAQRDEARRLLRDTVLVAPVSGTVSRVLAESGEVVAAGQPVVMLLGNSGVEIEVEVPERVFVHLTEGDAAQVDLPMSGRRDIDATVTSVGRATAGPGRLFPVVVTLNDPEVAAGMAADVTFRIPLEGQIAVPLAALMDANGTGPQVMRVNDSVVELVAIELRAIEGEWAIVDGGVGTGDQVVVAGQAGVVAGDRVEVR